jgi:hypothetical protein
MLAEWMCIGVVLWSLWNEAAGCASDDGRLAALRITLRLPPKIRKAPPGRLAAI